MSPNRNTHLYITSAAALVAFYVVLTALSHLMASMQAAGSSIA